MTVHHEPECQDRLPSCFECAHEYYGCICEQLRKAFERGLKSRPRSHTICDTCQNDSYFCSCK